MAQNNRKSITTGYTVRPYVVLVLPLNEEVDYLRPEQVVVSIENLSIDFGALCYLNRPNNRRISRNYEVASRLVNLESINSIRRKQINKSLKYFSALITDGGKRPITVYSIILSFVNLMDWADDNGYESILNGGEATKSAFRAFVKYIEGRFMLHEIEQDFASREQYRALSNLEAITGDSKLATGINLLSRSRDSEGTLPATDIQFGQVLSMCESIFLGMSKLVLEQKPYPFKLQMPKYLGWNDNHMWVFPGARWCIPPHLHEAIDTLPNLSYAYDFKYGTVKTFDEIIHRYSYTTRGKVEIGTGHANQAINGANSVILSANNDSRSSHRLKAAMQAHNSFLLLFVAQTGLNASVTRQLEWDESIKIGPAQFGFREIKWRAEGKEINSQIRTKFLPLFKRFIELRAYILNGEPFQYLFLSLGKLPCVPHQLSLAVLHNHYKTLKSIDPYLPKLGTRKLRATAHDWYNRHIDKAITARVFGHSEDTINKAYEAGSPNTHLNEMSNYLEKVHQKVISSKVIGQNYSENEGGVKGPLGTCEAAKSPVPISADVPVQPDCIDQAGCLFCNHHHVTANEEDTRKLASCAYVIQQAIYLPGAEQHFKPSLDQIDGCLNVVRTFDGCAEMVDWVVLDVNQNGNLDPYWAEKLILLDNLEVIL